MKRDVIVSRLIKEGFTEKTLVKFSDKQLNDLSERILGEQMTTQSSSQPQVTANVNDPNFGQVMAKLKQSGVKNINVTEEDEIGESKKKKVKKPTIYDKALKDLGGEEGVIKFLEKGMKGDKKKKEVNEVDMGLTIKSTPKSDSSFGGKPKSPKKSTPKKKEVETDNEEDLDESLHGIVIATIKDRLKKDLGRDPEDHEVDHEHNKFIDTWKKEIESKKSKDEKSTEEDVEEEKPSAGLSKEKKSEVVKKAKSGGDIGNKGKGFEKLSDKAAKEYGSKEKGEKVAAAAMWKNIKRESVETKKWVNNLIENEQFHGFTSKNEILELIQLKLNESEVESKVPEFMTYNSIKSAGGPAVAPTKPKTNPGTKPGTSPGKPKPRTPYEPGIGPKHKPKAYGLKEDDIMELDHAELKDSPRFEELRNALAKNINVSVAYVKNDGTVRHMLVKRYLSSYVPSEKEKTEKQMNINQNHDVKRVIDLNAYNKSLRETGDKELSAKKAWRTINLDNVLGFMVRGNFIDLRDENEIMERFGEEIYNSLTKSMVSTMQANQAEVEAQPA